MLLMRLPSVVELETRLARARQKYFSSVPPAAARALRSSWGVFFLGAFVANSGFVHDRQPLVEAVQATLGQQALDRRLQCFPALILQAEHHNPRMGAGRVMTNVGEIQVECQKNPRLGRRRF